MKNKPWYSIQNQANTIDVMVYGAIVSGSWKWDDSDVVAQDFIKAFADAKSGDVANIYVNSPGGSVFTTAGIIAIIERAKEKGVQVNAYIDGLAASAASFLVMAADNVYVYDTSTIMVHRAMMSCYGNADDLQEGINLLKQIEDSTIIPMYMAKAKEGVTEDDIRALLKAETWLGADAFLEKFNATRIENTKKVAACADLELLQQYKNAPQELLISSSTEEDSHNARPDEGIENTNPTATPDTQNKLQIDTALAMLKLAVAT